MNRLEHTGFSVPGELAGAAGGADPLPRVSGATGGVASLAALANQLRDLLSPETRVLVNEPLARRTTLRVGGPADLLVEPASEADLVAVRRFCARHALPFMVLGRGSNLLVADGGIRGVVVCLAHANFGRIEVDGERLRCGAGARLKQVAQEARRHALAGLEFLEGIPGSVGGALRMNAGAHGSSTFDIVERVRCLTPAGDIEEKPVRELPVEYRACPLLKHSVALAAVFRGRRASENEITARLDAFSQRRWETQPREASAGCMFKNPPTVTAGRLIDELGLKGTRVGGAMVSEVHANFIVNTGGATARDILRLIAEVRDRGRAARGIDLETEVEIVGDT